MENNHIIDCDIGLMVGGGRNNLLVGNSIALSSLAVHIDNRGMNWQRDSALFPTGDLWKGFEMVSKRERERKRPCVLIESCSNYSLCCCFYLL